jgi:hypothetical protein
LFLYIFGLYRGPKKKNWVSLRHRSRIL